MADHDCKSMQRGPTGIPVPVPALFLDIIYFGYTLLQAKPVFITGIIFLDVYSSRLQVGISFIFYHRSKS